VWTQFWDMSSGGGQKLKWHYIYIEAPEEQAITIFKEMFGRNPYNVTCACCGSDYAVDAYPTLEEATEFHRRGFTLEEYLSLKDDCNKYERFHIVYEKDIDPELLAYSKYKKKYNDGDNYDYDDDEDDED
jgi:hypothetical protein